MQRIYAVMAELRLLGPPEIHRGGVVLSLPTRKLWAIVAYLATRAQPQTREKLATLLWENQDEERARANLRQELYRLRGMAAEELFEIEPNHLALRGVKSDLEACQQLISQSRHAEALQFFRGEFAQGLSVRGAPAFEDWLTLEREHWKNIWKQAARHHAQNLENQQPIEALKLYQQILDQDPFQEDIQRATIGLVAALEGIPAALKLYESYKTILYNEFSLQPLQETRDLLEQIRYGKIGPLSPAPPTHSLPSTLEHPALIGREPEWALMEAAWKAGKAIYLSGPPGVGKTRLMLEFARSKGSFLHLEGRPSDSGIPYAYTTRAIRQSLVQLPGLAFPGWVGLEISRLLPELSPEPPPPITSEDGKLRLLEALTEWIRLMAQGGAGAIVADDLHFVTDASSAEVAAYSMARILPEGRMHSLSAFRGEELNPVVLESIRQQVERDQAVLIELQPLSEAGTRDLIQSLSKTEAPLFSRRLYQATGGNPLFVLETLRNLFASGELQVEQETWVTPYDEETQNYSELPLPPSVREAVSHRVDRLGGGLRRFLEAASLTGEGFGLEELSGATALSEWEELGALETAVSTGLVRPEGESYSFSHDLVRRALSDGMSPERSRLLHRKLAANLERLDSPPGRIAEHLEQARKPKEAVPWRIKAAQAAEGVYANREAVEQYQKALDDGASNEQAFHIRSARVRLWKILDEREPWEAELQAMTELARQLKQPDLQAQTVILWAELDNLSGHYKEALSRLEPLLESSLPAGLLAQARFQNARAQLTLGRVGEAERNLQQVLEDQTMISAELAGDTHLLLCDSAIQQNQLAVGQHHARMALQAFETTGNRQGQALALRNLGLVLGLGGDSAGAVQTLEQALEQAKEVRDLAIQRKTLLNLFKFLFESGQLEASLARLQEGLALAREPQDPFLEGIFLNNLSVVHRMRGDIGKAIQTLSEALQIAEKSGIAQQRVRRHMSMAEYHLDLDHPQGAWSHIQAALEQIEPAKLGELRPWLATQQARYELTMGQAHTAIEHLEQLLAQGSITDPNDHARAAWVLASAWLALDKPHEALKAVTRYQVPPNPPFQARALGVRLVAQTQLGLLIKELLNEAETLLDSGTVPALEILELRQTLAAALHTTSQLKQAQQQQQEARKLVLELASTLNNYPELEQSFLERHKNLLEAGNDRKES